MASESGQQTLIIGTGLGGLLTGAFLATRGHPVLFLEALAIPGGRFTHIDFEGFAVPTGAFHVFPGGQEGPIATCLRRLGLTIDLVEPLPSFTVVLNGHTYALDMLHAGRRSSGLRRAIGITSKARLSARLLRVFATGLLGGDLSVADGLRGLTTDESAWRLFDHFTKFSIGMGVEQASAVELLRSLRVQHGSREGFLRQGNRGLITALLDLATRHGAQVRLRTTAARILCARGAVTGVETTDGETLRANLVICNAGAAQTVRLLGDHAPAGWEARMRRLTPAFGATHAVRCRRPLHAHASIEIPADLRHIAGIAPVSNLCPDLCPPGWHFSLAYQALDPGESADGQLAAGREELHQYLGADADIFNTAVYRETYPAAFVGQCVGQHGRHRFPSRVPGVRGLYLVGQDVAGYGFAAETIGDSCRQLWRHLS